MKINLLPLAVLALCTPAALSAGPLSETTAVHTRPDRESPAITILKAGTEPLPAATALGDTPAGWMAIELPGPFEGYIENKDLSKSLDVKPGATIRVAPNANAGVLTVAEKGDKTSITGLRGRWTQISLDKPLIGYISVGGAPGYVPPIATTPATAVTAPKPAPPTAPSTAIPSVYGAAPGVAVHQAGQGDLHPLARQFEGQFVSTRRPLRPRRPYDYALNDDAGRRHAFIDVSKLLLTDQIERYLDRPVVVFGIARTVPGGKDIVIQAETLRLK
ncbi:MAG: SH3 domain-containing protein [Opitutus sp.]